MNRTRPLSFEQLEDRYAPAVWGNPWPDGAHLTLSFAPDGTAVGSASSTLFQTLNAVAPTAVWEHLILQAVQTWAVNANLNVGVVHDDGLPLGTPGAPQGDPRFGDIRVAAIPMAPDVMAITTPFDPLAGTWSGDIRLNSNYLFGTNGSPGVDLLTALIHEAGHVFGLPDNSDTSSVEYRYYQGVRTTLGASDVAALQALYGPRQGAAGDSGFATASSLNFLQNSNGSLGIQANGDINTLQEADYYSFVPPLNVGSFTVDVHTTGVSLLEARVTVYNASHRVVGSAVSTDPLGGDLLVTVPQLLPLSTYYVEVQSASGSVFGVGSYQLQVQATPLVSGLLGLLNNTVSTVQTVAADLIPNNSLLTATVLPPLFSQTSSHFDYSFRGNLVGPSDDDYFRVQAPTPAAGTPVVLTAMVWATDSSGLLPQLTVYDANGNAVNAEVLVNENGTYTVQLVNATPGAAYFVEVNSSSASSGHNAGNYLLAVQFSPQAQTLLPVTSGALDATQTEADGTLTVRTTQLFHFVLSAGAPGNPSGVGVDLTILDAAGNVVGSVQGPAGQPVSLTVLLAAGTYQFRYDVFAPAGQVVPRVSYSLSGVGISDPIGPQSTDPTEDPQSAPASSGTTSSDSTSTDSSSTDSTSTDDTSTDSTSTDPTSTDSTSTDSTSTDSTTPTSSDGSSSSSPSGTSSGTCSQQSTWSYTDDPSGVQPEDPSSTPTSAALLLSPAPARTSLPAPPTVSANEAGGSAAPIALAVHAAAAAPPARPPVSDPVSIADAGKGVAVVASAPRTLETLPPTTSLTARVADDPTRPSDSTPAAPTSFRSVQVTHAANALQPGRLLAVVGQEVTDTQGGLPEILQVEEQLPEAAPPLDGQGLSSAGRNSATFAFASSVPVRVGFLGVGYDGSRSGEQAGEPARQGAVLVAPAPLPSGWEAASQVAMNVPSGSVDSEPLPAAEIAMPRPAMGALVVFSLGAFASGVAADWGEPEKARRAAARLDRPRRLSI